MLLLALDLAFDFDFDLLSEGLLRAFFEEEEEDLS